MIWQWFLHITGTNDEQGLWYAFWSGFGSDIGELAIVGGMVSLYRKQACHDLVRVPLAGWHVRCWRLGHHQVEGTPYKACRKHHPALPDKAKPGDIRRAYDEARSAQ